MSEPGRPKCLHYAQDMQSVRSPHLPTADPFAVGLKCWARCTRVAKCLDPPPRKHKCTRSVRLKRQGRHAQEIQSVKLCVRLNCEGRRVFERKPAQVSASRPPRTAKGALDPPLSMHAKCEAEVGGLPFVQESPSVCPVALPKSFREIRVVGLSILQPV